MRAILVSCAIGAAAAGLSVGHPGLWATSAGLQATRAAETDPVTAILAAHKAADAAYAKAVMSPFTAVAVQYFQPGQSVRLGVGPSGAAFGAAPAGPEVIDLSLDDGAFWITPVSGARPAVVTTTGNGDVAGLPGSAVAARTRLKPRDVVRVGRFFVEFYARPDTGNARVFNPESPARKAFTGLKWFPPDPTLRVKARFMADPSPTSVKITTSRGLQKDYFRVGRFEFAIGQAALRLMVLATMALPKAGDELFVAFRDQTSGAETYGVGRYLFIPFAGAEAAYVLDFNAATNPLCNYSPHYNCPIPLRENSLTVPIRAGEMKYPALH